jgi:lysozyme
MNGYVFSSLKTLLRQDEGCKLFPYLCSEGVLSIGIGRNLRDRGISEQEAMTMLENDIHYFYDQLKQKFSFFESLDDIRKIVLVNMCFNLGLKNFLEFKRMLIALQNCDYTTAAKEMLNSRWALQVKERATYLSEMMEKGKWISRT